MIDQGVEMSIKNPYQRPAGVYGYLVATAIVVGMAVIIGLAIKFIMR